MRQILFAALLIAGASPVALQAQATETPEIKFGNGLYFECASDQPYDVGICDGFIIGASAVLQNGYYCQPQNVVWGQVIDVVKAGLKNHPEERQRLSHELVRKYLTNAWPCKTRR